MKCRAFFTAIPMRVLVLIFVILIGMAFFCPITIYRTDSPYLWYWRNGITPLAREDSPLSYITLYVDVNKEENLEVIAYSDYMIIGADRDKTKPEDETTEFHATTHEILKETRSNGYYYDEQAQLNIRVSPKAYTYDEAYVVEHDLYTPINFDAIEDLNGYAAFIFKKDGRIVGSEVYKIYGTEGCLSLTFRPVVVMEYPIISAGVTEIAVRQQLQQFILLDHIFMLNGALETPYEEAMRRGVNAYSPLHNPNPNPDP